MVFLTPGFRPEAEFNNSHQHGILPGLKWVSGGDVARTSHVIVVAAEMAWWRVSLLVEWDESLLSQFRNFDFRYLRRQVLPRLWYLFVDKLWEAVGQVTHYHIHYIDILLII